MEALLTLLMDRRGSPDHHRREPSPERGRRRRRSPVSTRRQDWRQSTRDRGGERPLVPSRQRDPEGYTRVPSQHMDRSPNPDTSRPTGSAHVCHHCGCHNKRNRPNPSHRRARRRREQAALAAQQGAPPPLASLPPLPPVPRSSADTIPSSVTLSSLPPVLVDSNPDPVQLNPGDALEALAALCPPSPLGMET